MDKTVLQNTEKVYQAHLHHPAWFIQVVNLLKWHMRNFLRQHILTFPGAWIIDSGSEMVLSYENAVQFQWTIVQWCFWHIIMHTQPEIDLKWHMLHVSQFLSKVTQGKQSSYLLKDHSIFGVCS